MPGFFLDLHGIRVYLVPALGPELRTGADAVDLMSAASEGPAAWIAIPVSRLGDDFFELRTRIAGEIVQKFAIYGAHVAIVGDISPRIEASRSLAAFVAESNRSDHLWFVNTMSEFNDRLAQRQPETR